MRIPIFPLDLVLLPSAPLPLHIFEPRYREMVADCLEQDAVFGVVRAEGNHLWRSGTTARILRVLERYEDGRLDILCQGLDRFEIATIDKDSRSFLEAEVQLFHDEDGQDATREQREQCAALYFEAMSLAGLEPSIEGVQLDQPLSFALALRAPADLSFRQYLLELRSDVERTRLLTEFFAAILPRLRAQRAELDLSGTDNGSIM